MGIEIENIWNFQKKLAELVSIFVEAALTNFFQVSQELQNK
jgi:hypothetical protein